MLLNTLREFICNELGPRRCYVSAKNASFDALFVTSALRLYVTAHGATRDVNFCSIINNSVHAACMRVATLNHLHRFFVDTMSCTCLNAEPINLEIQQA